MSNKTELRTTATIKLDVKINEMKPWEQSRQGYITIENKVAATFTVIDGWIVNYVLSNPDIGIKDALPIELIGGFKLHGFNLPLIPIDGEDLGDIFSVQNTCTSKEEINFSVEKEVACLIKIYDETPVKNYRLATIYVANAKLAELVISDKTITDSTFTGELFTYIPKEVIELLENNNYKIGIGVPH